MPRTKVVRRFVRFLYSEIYYRFAFTQLSPAFGFFYRIIRSDSEGAVFAPSFVISLLWHFFAASTGKTAA
jgi:hypothetical protein